MSDLGVACAEARSALSPPALAVSASEPAPLPLQELLPQLSVDRSATRCVAVNHLARSPHAPFLVEPLLALLNDENREVRRTAISALGESADARALQPLRALLKGSGPLREDGGTRTQAARGPTRETRCRCAKPRRPAGDRDGRRDPGGDRRSQAESSRGGAETSASEAGEPGALGGRSRAFWLRRSHRRRFGNRRRDRLRPLGLRGDGIRRSLHAGRGAAGVSDLLRPRPQPELGPRNRAGRRPRRRRRRIRRLS
jgi:hypothetical protein